VALNIFLQRRLYHLRELAILYARDPLALLQQILAKQELTLLALRYKRRRIGGRR